MLSEQVSKNLPLPILGSTEFIEVSGIKDVPAKVDTGADSSSIWASQISVTKDGVLHFCLFDEGSPLYTGKTIERKDFKVVVVRSSSGHEQIRYRAHLSITLSGRKIKVLFTLSDRSNNNFPVLIGRRTIARKFLVDVSKNHTDFSPKNPKTKLIQKQFEKDPYEFHQKYLKNHSGDISHINLKKGEN